VSVLLIVALATILVVVASMMSQIERKAASNSAKIEQARANALFALDVAVNQLQREAGPDQRITARAEILDATNAPPLSTSNSVKQPLWTGVWKTGPNGLDVVSSGTPQRTTSLGSLTPTTANKVAKAAWLVSGTNLDPTSFNDANTTGTNATAAVLAKNLGTNTTKLNVTVPLVPMQSGTNTSGAYAYWVSDEGVKARVNLSDPTLGVSASNDPSRSQLHLISPQATAGHKGVDAFNGTDVRGDTNLSKVSTVQSLSNLSGLSGLGGTNAATILPDVTTVSRGVLADVRRGGLKKDLTAAFEDPSPSSGNGTFSTLMTNYGHGANMVYRSASSEGLTVPAVDTGVTPPTDGLLWYNLFFHYNSYKGTMPSPAATSGSSVAPTGSGNPATLPQVQSPRAYDLNMGGGVSTKTGSLTPVPIAYRVDVALSSYNNGTVAAPDWRLRLHYYPQLVLWNPYSVRLNYSNYQFQRNIGAFSGAGSYSAILPTLTCIQIVSTTGNNTTTGPYFQVNQMPTTGIGNTAGRLILQTKTGDCPTLEPGETRVFALDQDTLTSSPQLAITFSNLVSNPSMSADFSQYCDVLTGVIGNGTSTGPPFSTSDPTTTIKVNLSAPSLRCQNTDTFILPASLKWPANDGTQRYTGSGGWNIPAAASPVGTPWTGNNTLQMQQLNGAPRRIIGFYVRQKGLMDSSGTNSYSNAANSIPLFMGNSATLHPVDDAFSYAWEEVYLSQLGTIYQNGQTDVTIQPTPDPATGPYWETSFGSASAGAGSLGLRCVVRDVPDQPMVSLGQFMHMPAANFWSTGVYQMLGMGSMFVGGSCASPVISTDANAKSIALGTSGAASNMKLFLDDSFLANEALFDRFFFSTVPPSSLGAAGTTYPATWTAFNAANSGTTLSDPTKPLLNARMKPFYKDGTAPKMADLRDVEKAAANLTLDGAFNVNSTSLAAWKAFLGSMSGNDIRMWDASLKSAGVVSAGSGTPISRFWSGTGRMVANQPWSGLRVLSDGELTELATRIVEQVKVRGPFLSMADFLNRRLGIAGALTRCGTLQAAIDSMVPDINATAKAVGKPVTATSPPEANKIPDLIAANMKDANGNTWNTALGIPGYLMQQDLVQAYSAAMAVRSDTFVVRTYGEVRNPRTGAIEGRAWAEAVVQRTPILVDDSQPPETALASMNTTNQTFGRRFKVVSFRWLNENEI
jgi:hypothetical protein